jgi:hypothetical protein
MDGDNMIYTVANPKGIDRVARKLATQLNNKLEWPNINIFDIVEENIGKKGKPILEHYTGGNEYKDVLLNDNTNGSIFIVDSEEHLSEQGIRFDTSLKVVFILDLRKLFPNSVHRPKREAELKAVSVLRDTRIFKEPKLQSGIENSLNEFFYSDLAVFDMHPYYTFSVVGKVNYSVSCLNN